MLLKEHLEEYTKEELLDYARSLELKKYSGLRKAELIERILECFCSEDMLRNRLECLTNEQMSIFRKACDSPQNISVNETMDSVQLCIYLLGTYDEESERFFAFEEVSAVFKRIDDAAFKSEQFKKGWMVECIQFFIKYYGIAPIEVVYKLYRLKVRDTIDEMIDMILQMPVDIVESCIIPMERLGMQDWPKENPIYSSKALLIHIPLLENDEIGDLLDRQMDKDFYIPSVQQIVEMGRLGYEESSLAYKKLKTFFIRKLHLSYDEAVLWCLRVWINSYEENSPTGIVRKMSDSDVAFNSEKQMNEFIGLLMDAYNHTRMIENRGHNPNELTKRELAGGKHLKYKGL